MNVAQREYAGTYSDPPPRAETLDRMEELFRRRRAETITVRTKRMQIEMFDQRFTDMEAQGADRRNEIVNRLTQAALHLAEIEREIIRVAGLIVAEDAAMEILAA